MIQFDQRTLEQFIRDPVMAAYVLMGAELDTFQRYRLRMLWWVPFTVDSSGVSTGKTFTLFVYLNLRCILLPDHVAGVYFPNWAVGQEEFWSYYDRTMERSEIFLDQLEMHNKVYGLRGSSAWQMFYKSGSKLTMPAGSFFQDAQTQATRRFNTMAVDDWLRAEDMGDGVSKQLVGRTTREAFNQAHPIWGNHVKFFGHAETPMHKGYVRVKAYQRAILDGSQHHGLFSFNYLDWTPEYAKRLEIKKIVEDDKRTMPEDQFRRQWLGIWSRDGATYYPEGVLWRNCRSSLSPVFRREYDSEVNILGFDSAPGQSFKADYCAAMIYRIIELGRLSTLAPTYTHPLSRIPYHCSFTFAHMMRNVSAAQASAFIHLLHRIFSFSYIVMDPGGGGLWIYKDMRNKEQEINGARVPVVPLCTIEEPIQTDKQAIVVFFKRGPQLNTLHQQQYLTGDDGFLDASHRRYREGWEAGEFVYPMPIENRAPAEVRAWSQSQLWAQRYLDLGLKQLARVRQLTRADGTADTTARGFARFQAPGKKDLAYAGLYAFTGAQLWMRDHALGLDGDNEVACEFGHP